MATDVINLALEPRTVVGKQVRALRQSGLVPAVIHDHGKDSVIVAGPYIEVVKTYQQAGKHHPVQLKVGAKDYLAIIKDVDFEPKKRQLRHVVFNAIKADEKVEAEIPIQARYDEGNDASPAERAGLIVLHAVESVEVEALPKDLPDFLEFDGEKLVEIGDSATVADLIVPPGIEMKTEATQAIASVYEPSALQAANELAGGTATEEAEPEVEEGAEEEPAEAAPEGEDAAKEPTEKDEEPPEEK